MVKKRSLRETVQNKIATGTRTYEKRRGLDGTEGQIIGRQLKTGEVRKIDYQRREFPWEGYRLIFQAARDLLLSRGYEKNSPDLEAQNLFAEMIPDSAELRQERKTTLKQLKSRDEKTRFLAATHLDKLARHRHQDECVVRHPDIVAALIDALDKESRRKNSSVRLQEILIQGLGMVHFRHLEDYRIFDQLFPFLDCPEKTLRIAALRATSTFRNPAKWPPVMAALSDRDSTQPLLSAALQHVGEQIPLSIKRKLQPILAGLLDRRLNARVQEQVSWAICTTIEERTVDAMIELLADIEGARKILAKTVEMSTSGDRMQFLERRFISQLP